MTGYSLKTFYMRGQMPCRSIIYRGEQEIYIGFSRNDGFGKVQAEMFKTTIHYVESLLFKDLPLYINDEDSLVRALCLDRLQHG